MAAMVTRTPGTTTRVITLPARRDTAQTLTVEMATGSGFNKSGRMSRLSHHPAGSDTPTTTSFGPRPLVTSLLLDLFEKKVCFRHVISIPAEGKVKR